MDLCSWTHSEGPGSCRMGVPAVGNLQPPPFGITLMVKPNQEGLVSSPPHKGIPAEHHFLPCTYLFYNLRNSQSVNASCGGFTSVWRLCPPQHTPPLSPQPVTVPGSWVGLDVMPPPTTVAVKLSPEETLLCSFRSMWEFQPYLQLSWSSLLSPSFLLFFLFLSVISRKESHYFILVLAYLSLVTKDGEHMFTYIDLLYKDFFWWGVAIFCPFFKSSWHFFYYRVSRTWWISWIPVFCRLLHPPQMLSEDLWFVFLFSL